MSSTGDAVPSGSICLLRVPPRAAGESPLRHLEHLLPLLRPGPGCVRSARSRLFSPQRSASFALSEIRFHRGATGCADGLSWGCGRGLLQSRRELVGTGGHQLGQRQPLLTEAPAVPLPTPGQGHPQTCVCTRGKDENPGGCGCLQGLGFFFNALWQWSHLTIRNHCCYHSGRQSGEWDYQVL